MSAQDRQLLDLAGLSAARVATMLNKSRQTVARGVRGDADYFTEADMLRICDFIGEFSPSQQHRLQEAIATLFGGVADRLRVQTATRDLRQALGTAERVWLVFRNFAASRQMRSEAYDVVFDALAGRPLPKGDKAKRFEVVAFCGSFEDQTAIEGEFGSDWFSRKLFVAIPCEIVTWMPPMVVVDPHKADGRGCYVLSAGGFVGLDEMEAASWATSFAAATSRRYRPAAAVNEKPLNMLVAAVPELLEAEARIVEADANSVA